MLAGPKLLPVDPFERAQVLALAKEIELYIELPARACYPEAFFGMQVPACFKARLHLIVSVSTTACWNAREISQRVCSVSSPAATVQAPLRFLLRWRFWRDATNRNACA